LAKSRSTVYGSYAIVNDGDALGQIRFCGDNGVDYNSIGAEIKAEVDGTPGTSDMPGRLVFSTTADGASSPTERLRIDSSGRVGLGTSSPVAQLSVVGLANSEAIRIGGIGGISTINGGYLTLASNAKSFGNSGDFQNILANAGVGLGVISPMRSPGSATVGGVWVASGNATADTTYAWSSMTPALTWNTSGQVGIGTTGPLYPLDVRAANAGSTTYINVDNTSATATSLAGIYFSQNGTPKHSITAATFGADYMAFNIGAGGSISERARIDSSGRLLVGTSSTSADTRLLLQGTSANVNAGAYIHIQRGTLPAGTGSPLGRINFADNSSNIGAWIASESEGAWTSGSSHPGRLVFSTTADGASSPTERMRISNAGDLLLGTGGSIIDPTSGTVDGFYFNVVDRQAVFSRDASAPLVIRRRTSDGVIQGFYRAGTLVGTISVTTTAVAYNTSSDYRLKENIAPLTGAADRLNQLQVHRFNFIADPDKTVDGFIAHEAQAVVPECVNGTKDEVDADGNPVYQGIDQSKLVPLLTAALQEALQKIEVLEQRLTDAGIA